LHANPPGLPKQVHLRCVPLTSYGFLQTPPLASDALASRIVFPSVGVTPPSFRWPGLPASPGKQKKAARRPPAPSTSSDHSLCQPPQVTSLPGLTSLYHPAHLLASRCILPEASLPPLVLNALWQNSATSQSDPIRKRRAQGTRLSFIKPN